MRHIELCDVTLRDGAQGEGIQFSKEDKLGIISLLDCLGIDMVEPGSPGMNTRDRAVFDRQTDFTHIRFTAFGQTRRKNVTPREDGGLLRLSECPAKSVTIFGKSHVDHVIHVLKVSRQDNLDMIASSISFLREQGKDVIFDAEHFFSGYQADPQYALATLTAAAQAGCSLAVLCDTNGGSLPGDVYRITREVHTTLPTLRLGIHCHNDMGLAIACSLAAVEAGADHVQGSFTGIGERCGNTALCQLIPTLTLKLGYDTIPLSSIAHLTEAARYVADIANTDLASTTPYVGAGAFAHKAGTHVDAMQKLKGAYEHIDPKAVGNERRYLTSELAGRSAVYEKIRRIDPGILRDDQEVALVLSSIKRLETNGWQFDSADASLELLILRSLGRFESLYKTVFFHVSDDYPYATDTTGCLASVKIIVDGQESLESAEGDGPVHALDTALRKCLVSFFPAVSRVRLIDYKVRVISPNDATAAKVRVLMNSSDGVHTWTTVGTSRDIIRASWKALSDSVDYFFKQYADLA